MIYFSETTDSKTDESKKKSSAQKDNAGQQKVRTVLPGLGMISNFFVWK